MVSQFTGRQHSPVDPCDGISYDFEDAHDSPRLLDIDHCPCQLDIRLLRHKAAWVAPLCVQQPLQDLYLQRLTRQNSEDHLVVDAPYPLGSSSSSLGASLAETPLSEDTADSMHSISSQGSGKSNNDFSVTTEELEVPLGYSQHVSLLRSPKAMATSPSSEVASACFESPHAAVSADEGVNQVNRRSKSLNSFSSETFVLPVDVEKENTHFHAADMMIAAMEEVKWHLLSQQQPDNRSTEEASRPPRSHPVHAEGSFHTHTKQEPGSFASSDSGYKGCTVLKVSPVAETPASSVIKEASKCDLDGFFILESEKLNYITGIFKHSCSSSKSVICMPDFTSAQQLAKELFQIFRKCWMLSEANYQLPVSLITAGSAVRYVQEDFDPSVNVIQEVTLTPRIRGTEDWAPPGFQIIHHVHPPLRRDMVVVAQNFLCAGCGTAIEPKFVKRLRYCEYLGKYFCDCCHSYADSCIPARILTSWDFRKYYVSNFSKWLLESIWHQPVFSLLSHNHSLYAKAKELDRVKDIQEQLFHIKKMLKTCRFADSALKDFEQVPSHLTDELHLFSLDDFVRTKRGLLAPLLKDILKASLVHVASCELCQGKGFICEFCQSTAVIFPFQTTTCTRCSACKACFHKQCFQSTGCPRCARFEARRRLSKSLPSAAT
uniref:protein associated with UVRAG as autophagy enhancer n=1 Tax=Jaculus jaculus TaxID=51337 RepID=UPI001E1B4E9E|nr:protein associated with UVRAG as autophagy enhancer [Jaculus jaculus]